MHFHYHFDNNKSHTYCPGLESLPLRWEIANDCPRCDAAEIIVLRLKLKKNNNNSIHSVFINVQACQHKYPVQSQCKDTNKIQKKHKDTKQNTKQAKQKQYSRIKAT